MLNYPSIAAAVLSVAAALPPTHPPQAAPPPDVNPITHIVQNLGRDLVGMVSVPTVVILGVGGGAAAAAGQRDDTVNDWTLDHPAPSWTKIGKAGGDGWVQGALALGTWGIGSVAGHQLTAHVGSDLIRAQMLNMVTTRVVKIAVDRRRPSGGRHAFPSGHTSATFTTAGVLHRHFGWKAGLPAYAAAGFVGLTRVRDRDHWVSDTVFGAAMGVAAAWTVTRGHQAQSWSVTPVALPGGGALVLRW